MQINSQIPNTMSHKGLEYLARIAASVEGHGTILEAGSLYGCTAWVLSKNSDRDAKVVAIDPWEHQGFLNRFQINNHRVPELSIHAFRAYTHDCENLTAVQGYSPEAAESIELENLDLVFEDAAHSYEVLKKNVEYFYPKLNPGGVFCGDDYQSAFPGVIRCVDELAAKLGVKPEVSGQVWAIRKPLESKASNTVKGTLYERLGNVFDSEVGVSIWTSDGEHLKASPHCLTPNIFHPSSLNKISLFWHIHEESDIDFIWQVEFSDGSISPELNSGDQVELNGKNLIAIRVEITGQNTKNYSVGYQIAEWEGDSDELKKLGPSRERFNGAWLKVSSPTKKIYALGISLVSPELKKMRRNHASLIKIGREMGERLYGDAGKKK